MKVIKRNGSEVLFDKEKIIEAITKAFKELYSEIDVDMWSCILKIADEIENIAKSRELHVEEIQDIVERKLMATKFKDVAKAYINYRYLHGLARDRYRELMDSVSEKLSAKNIQNQNANIDEASFGGRIGEAADVITKRYALEYLISPMARSNHENNEIYIHDLNAYAVGNHNCLSIPFDDLLAKGFNTRQTDIRPAQSINTAFQLVAVIFQVQSLQQFGGVSATHLDWTMVPYVRKSFYKHFKHGLKYIDKSNEHHSTRFGDDLPIDAYQYTHHNGRAYDYALDMTINECKQGAEGLIHNLNTLQSRSGCQLPFSSINYGTCTLPEGRMIIKALLDAAIKGVGKLNKTPIFPCVIFQCMNGVNRKPGDPNYDLFKLALKSTSLRLYPNYANCDVSMQKDWVKYDRDMREEYINSMNDSDYNALMNLLETRPELKSILLLDVVEE